MNNSIVNTTSSTDCSKIYIEPSIVSWTKTVVYLMLLALALFGNVLVIWIVYKYKRMRTASNFLIVNVAVSNGHFILILVNQPTTQCYENEIDNKYTMKILGTGGSEIFSENFHCVPIICFILTLS